MHFRSHSPSRSAPTGFVTCQVKACAPLVKKADHEPADRLQNVSSGADALRIAGTSNTLRSVLYRDHLAALNVIYRAHDLQFSPLDEIGNERLRCR